MSRTRPLLGQRGYTAVELVMAVAIFAIGVTGVFAMQSLTAATNHHAKALSVATRIAESWQEQLAIDALKWTRTKPLTGTTWLTGATTSAGVWAFPAASADGTFGPSFTALGDYNDHSATPEHTVFCSHLRLTPLFSTPGSGLVRVEVRVFWPKHDRSGWDEASGNSYDYCQASALAAGAIDSDDFHFVHKTSAVRQEAGL
jgi:prepilin-type N-terminal cleavage/methylation domain-containing protein